MVQELQAQLAQARSSIDEDRTALRMAQVMSGERRALRIAQVIRREEGSESDRGAWVFIRAAPCQAEA